MFGLHHGRTITRTIVCAAIALGVSVPTMADINNGGVKGDGDTGSIKGVFKFKGEQKKPKPIRMDADPNCVAVWAGKKEPPVEQTFVFGENDTLNNVTVYISKGLGDKKYDAPKEAYVINQDGCRYLPHVSAVMAGRPIEIKNSDNTMHNVNFQPSAGSANAAFNVAQPIKDMVHPIKSGWKPAEGESFTCQVHNWMNAWVNVYDHPFFAVTADNGQFEITGLPPGEYEVSFWHEISVFRKQMTTLKVTVTAGEATEMEPTLTFSGKKEDRSFADAKAK
jgi:hypothetical protein